MIPRSLVPLHRSLFLQLAKRQASDPVSCPWLSLPLLSTPFLLPTLSLNLAPPAALATMAPKSPPHHNNRHATANKSDRLNTTTLLASTMVTLVQSPSTRKHLVEISPTTTNFSRFQRPCRPLLARVKVRVVPQAVLWAV